MKTAIKSNLSAVLAAGAAAGLALAAMVFSGSAQARGDVQWSVGVGVPGAVVSVGNVGSVYPQPVLVQPQPVYVHPAPVYVQPRPVHVHPAPVYVRPRPVFVQPAPVYVQPAPVYYYGPPGHRHRGGYHQAPQGYGHGYGPVYHQRDGWKGRDRDHWRDDDRGRRHGHRHGG